MTLDPVTAAARNRAIREQAIREAEAYVRSRIWALEDAAVNTLGDLYLAAYRQMAAALAEAFARYSSGEAWSASDALFRLRTETLLSEIAAEVARLTDESVAATLAAVVRGYQAGYYGSAWALDMGLRGVSAAAIPLLPVEAIRVAMEQPYLGSTFLDRFLDARDEFVRAIRRSIVDSQIRGEGIGAALRRLAQALGVDTGRANRLANAGLFARIEMIARTEILRASNEGALAVYEANADVLAGWEWVATKDERTCPICGALDGQVFAFEARQSPPPTGSHPRCRCTAAPALKNSALEARIVGPRQTYRDWAQGRGLSIAQDGGVLYFEGKRPPRSQTDAARQAAPNLYKEP